MKLIKKINILTIISIIGMHAVFANAHTKEEAVIEVMPDLIENHMEYYRLLNLIDNIIDENIFLKRESRKLANDIFKKYIMILNNSLEKILNSSDTLIKSPNLIEDILISQLNKEKSKKQERCRLSKKQANILARLDVEINSILQSSNTLLQKKSQIIEQLNSEEVNTYLEDYANNRETINIITRVLEALDKAEPSYLFSSAESILINVFGFELYPKTSSFTSD